MSFFIQQLRNMESSNNKELRLTQKNPKIGKDALIQLFHYYGEELVEDDFDIMKGRNESTWRFF